MFKKERKTTVYCLKPTVYELPSSVHLSAIAFIHFTLPQLQPIHEGKMPTQLLPNLISVSLMESKTIVKRSKKRLRYLFQTKKTSKFKIFLGPPLWSPLWQLTVHSTDPPSESLLSFARLLLIIHFHLEEKCPSNFFFFLFRRLYTPR